MLYDLGAGSDGVYSCFVNYKYKKVLFTEKTYDDGMDMLRSDDMQMSKFSFSLI